MSKDDFSLKVTELYRLVHQLKMQEGVNYFTALYEDLDAAEDFLIKAWANVSQYERD